MRSWIWDRPRLLPGSNDSTAGYSANLRILSRGLWMREWYGGPNLVSRVILLRRRQQFDELGDMIGIEVDHRNGVSLAQVNEVDSEPGESQRGRSWRPSWLTQGIEPWVMFVAEGEEVLGYYLVAGAGRCKTESRDNPLRID